MLTGEDGRERRLSRCPEIIRAEVKRVLVAEEERLAGAIERAARGMAVFGFAAYNPGRWEGGEDALAAMRAFADGTPPRVDVVLFGSHRMGKSALLLLSHLTLLRAGIRSAYLMAADLRRVFEARRSFDSAKSEEAEREIERLKGLEALHIDELRGTGRAGHFQEGLIDLLDNGRAVFAVATNLTGADMIADPDLGGPIAARLRGAHHVCKLRPHGQKETR